MRLLVITQAVDRQDSTLGFFHTWIEELSKRAEKIEVICLRKGEYDLPRNVSVYSLGKEKIKSMVNSQQSIVGKIRYIINFYKIIWKYRNQYDLVFVHMNQEYVLLGGFFWRVLGKKIFFWRNHPQGDMWTRLAVFLSNKVFCTSTSSFTAQFNKTIIMPAGIDTNLFKKNETRNSENEERKKNYLLMFGRISPIKKIELAIDAVSSLVSSGIDCALTIVGDVATKDEGYVETLKDRVEMAGVGAYVHFEKGVPFSNAPLVYQRFEIFLNFTPSGSFDKTVIEALSCGTKVLVSNQSMKNLLPDDSITNGDIDDIRKKIENFITYDMAQSSRYHEEASDTVRRQSLNMLMERLFTQFSQ